MRTLVVIALLGCASAMPFLQDTPEVVAERARFQQLWNAQAAAAAAAPDPHGSHHQAPVHHHQAAPQHHTFSAPQTHTTKWTGPVAATVPAGVQGSLSQVPDTADVAAARNAFLAAYNAQVAATTGQQPAAPVHHNTGAWNPQTPAAPQFNAIQPAPTKWTGPVAATVPAGVNGQLNQVADTAEVAAARNAFINSYNAALRATAGVPVAVQQHHQPAVARSGHAVASPKWTGPVAATVPAGLPGSVSQVAQTADVAAATAAFSQAYNAAVAATTGGRRF